ncbi:MAG TPA: LemA family protein [Gemmatimonadales bacterium]|nr:LemA family protein [Gemmatimonadales bacterium]
MRIPTRAFVATMVLAMVTSSCGYNRLQELDEQVNSSQAQIQTALQRRADLIENLVQTVKGVAAQESTIFIGVAEARSRLAGAAATGSLQEMAEADAAMRAPLGRLLAIAEAYPELKSAGNFTMLQDQLEGTENRIAVARNDYNASVEQFNAMIRRFPTVITAKLFGLGKPREYFQASEGAAEVPRVQF